VFYKRQQQIVQYSTPWLFACEQDVGDVDSQLQFLDVDETDDSDEYSIEQTDAGL
jgi:hypothetical protein